MIKDAGEKMKKMTFADGRRRKRAKGRAIRTRSERNTVRGETRRKGTNIRTGLKHQEEGRSDGKPKAKTSKITAIVRKSH